MSYKRTGFLLSACILALIFALAGCHKNGHDDNTFIRIKIRESNGEMLYLEKITLDGTVLSDSGRVDKNGEITFGIYTPDFEYLILGDRSDAKKILILAEKNQKIELFTTAGKFGDDYSVEGSAGSSLILELEKKKTNTLATLDSLAQVWMKNRYTVDNLEIKSLFDSLSEEITNSYKRFIISFIERYPKSPATIIAAYQMLRPGLKLLTLEDDLHVFQSVAQNLGDLYPENVHVIDFCKRTDDYVKEKEAFEERERLLKPGMPAPGFSLVSTTGDKVSLSSFEGKYLLVYFWDARRQECWEINKELAELYQKYHYQGFEILGIYYGEEKQLFLNAIRIDNLAWLHLFGNSIIEQQYNVRNNPMMILIDREGKIMNREINLNELRNRLNRIFPASQQELPVDSPGVMSL